MALHLFEWALSLSLHASMVASRRFLEHVALLLETPERTSWAILVALMVVTTPHVTSPDLFLGNQLLLGYWQDIIHDVVHNVFWKAPRLLHELLLSLLIKVGAFGMRATILHASHHGLKLFTPGVLLVPWIIGLVACLVTCVVMSTLFVAHHGFTECLQFLHRRRHCLRALEMACEIVSASMVTCLLGCHCGIEEVALRRDALEWALVLGAGGKAIFVLITLRTAFLDLLPGGLLRQVLIKHFVDDFLD